jgi:omega-6 fatty acid desaturase (delta-12 desaturase)
LLSLSLIGVQVPGLMGLILFHLQHSANSGYRARDSDFSARQTALKGSTYLTVPWLLRWITLNIEFHHIHHWSTRVPSYRLQDCHDDGEAKGMWTCITRIDTMDKFVKALFNVLWCDKRQQYITFWELEHTKVKA